MNRTVSKIGAAVVTVTVFLFAVFIIADFTFGSYFVCMLLPIGYIMMALSTFFIGLSIRAENKPDLWLKRLMLIHGIFFLSCFLMPMTGMFTSMANGEKGNGGDIALLFWCAYFLPIGVLAWKHFSKGKD